MSLKHKGAIINPNLVYHASNPFFRDLISIEGLKVMKGNSYSVYSPEESEPPAIFGSIKNEYDSTWDDDIWLIDCSLCNNKWFTDKEFKNIGVVTYENIPKEAISLIYKGTGKDKF